MKALYILLFLAAAMFMATASAEITGQAVVNDGNIAWTAAGAIGGSVDADQDVDAGHDGVEAQQDVQAEGIQAFASTGAIGEDGDMAVTTSAVQNGELDAQQVSEADDHGASAGQYTSIEGESAYAATYAQDEDGCEAGVVVEAESNNPHRDATVDVEQGAEAGRTADVDFEVDAGRHEIEIETENGAGAYQQNNEPNVPVATGSEVFAGAFASNGDSSAFTGVEVERGEITNTYMVAGADDGRHGHGGSAGVAQITTTDGRETETFTVANNDDRRDKSVVIIGHYGRGETTTTQAAVASDHEVEAMAITNAESHHSASFIEAESGHNDREAVAFGDEIFQFGEANNNHHHNVYVISHGH
jgi:hypothetical protein